MVAMTLALQVVSAVIALSALGLSTLVYVRQQRANANADVSVWFEVHDDKTYMVVKNHGPGVAQEIEAKFFDVDGEQWEPRWVSDGPQFPLFPVEALAAGEWIERHYFHVVGSPMPVMTHLTWSDRRRGVQKKTTWSGFRYSRG